MARKIQHKRGLEKNLPRLAAGEFALTEDTKKVFIGTNNGNVEVTNKEAVENVTAQLAGTVKEVNGVKPTNGKVVLPIPEVDTSNLRLKTDKITQTDVSEELLQQMAGNTPINATPADKSVTSEKIADKAINENHTAYLMAEGSPSINLFNKDTAITNHYIYHLDGLMYPANGYYASDFIEIQPNETYRRKYFDHTSNDLSFYDNDKKFISGISIADSPFIAPSNARYIRLSVRDTAINDEMLVKGTVIPKYVNGHPKIKNDLIIYPVWNNEDTEKTINIDTTDKKLLVVHVKKIRDMTIKVMALGLDKNNYYPINVVNCYTGSNMSYIASNGYYQVDVSKVDSVKIDSVASSTGTKAEIDYYFDEIPVVPYSTKNTTRYEFNKTAEFERTSTEIAQELHKGVLYTSFGNSLYKSDDYGVNRQTIHTFESDIHRIAVTENGNILAVLSNGKVMFSKNKGGNFTESDGINISESKLPHGLFGITKYKNRILMSTYATIPSGDPGKEVYMSEDGGETFNKIFDLRDYTDIPQSDAHIHSATYDPYEDLIWVGNGDGQSTQMIYISADNGETWHRTKMVGHCEFQPTAIIPLKDAVLFTSDQRLVGVARYQRPTGGTKIGSELMFDFPFILAERWGKENSSEVPIGSSFVVDWEKSVAYFSWAVVSSAFSGRIGDTLNHGEVFASNGHDFVEVYRRNETTQQSVYGIFGEPSHDAKLAIKCAHMDYLYDLIDVKDVWKH